MHCINSTFPGISVDGGMANFLKTNARAVVKLDSGLAPKDIAALADAGLTAYHAVKKSIPLAVPWHGRWLSLARVVLVTSVFSALKLSRLPKLLSSINRQPPSNSRVHGVLTIPLLPTVLSLRR